MLIEEQIKIARLIASGTPREVAINEVAPTSSIETSGPTVNMKKGKDYEVVNDKKNKKQKLPKGKKGGEIDKKSPSDLAKEKLDAIKQKQQELKKRRKESNTERRLEMLRRKKNVVRNSLADRVKKSNFSGTNIQTISKDEGGATAAGKAAGNIAKAGVATT